MTIVETLVDIITTIVDSLTGKQETLIDLKDSMVLEAPLVNCMHPYILFFISLSGAVNPFQHAFSKKFKAYLIIYNTLFVSFILYSVYVGVWSAVHAIAIHNTNKEMYNDKLVGLFFSVCFTMQSLCLIVLYPQLFRKVNGLISIKDSMLYSITGYAFRAAVLFLIIAYVFSVLIPSVSMYSKGDIEFMAIFSEIFICNSFALYIYFTTVNFVKVRSIIYSIGREIESYDVLLNSLESGVDINIFSRYKECKCRVHAILHPNKAPTEFMFFIASFNIFYIIVSSYIIEFDSMYSFISSISFLIKEFIYMCFVIYISSKINDLNDSLKEFACTHQLPPPLEIQRIAMYNLACKIPIKYSILGLTFRRKEFFINLFSLFLTLIGGYLKVTIIKSL